MERGFWDRKETWEVGEQAGVGARENRCWWRKRGSFKRGERRSTIRKRQVHLKSSDYVG